jgi:hypothetical protein
MKRVLFFFALGLIITGTLTPDFALSGQERGDRTYEITITNLTRGQIFSPPVLISHNGDFQLFVLGEPAIPELVALAEDGITEDLTGYISTLPSVLDYAVAAGGIPPGQSMTLEITTRGRFRYISAAGMLVTTNDAFFAIRGVRVPSRGERVDEAEAYDAGSETNSEDCAYIPGPPCGSSGVRDTSGAEGYVHIHAGIHGITDHLVPSMDDWRNPVAEITIRPIN